MMVGKKQLKFLWEQTVDLLQISFNSGSSDADLVFRTVFGQ